MYEDLNTLFQWLHSQKWTKYYGGFVLEIEPAVPPVGPSKPDKLERSGKTLVLDKHPTVRLRLMETLYKPGWWRNPTQETYYQGFDAPHGAEWKPWKEVESYQSVIQEIDGSYDANAELLRQLWHKVTTNHANFMAQKMLEFIPLR